MKNKLLITLGIIALLSLSACADTAADTDVVSATPNSTEEILPKAQSLQVEFNDREYNEIKVVELPTFVGTATELEAMNKAIATATDEFLAKIPEGGIQITSHPVITSRYIQVVMHYLSHQSDDIAGDVVTINYSIEEDDYITLDELFADDVEMFDIMNAATSNYESTANGNVVNDAEIVGFFIRETFEDDVYEFYVKMNIESSEAEKWTAIYTYLPDVDKLTPVDTQQIVDPLIVEKYEPELQANKIANELINSTENPQTTEGTATIVTNFVNGGTIEYHVDLVQEHSISYTGELTIEKLAQELSLLTGFDFNINSSSFKGDSAYVDWSPTSTLLAGLDDRTQKDEFFFFDVVSINWFMLDSLNDSIIKNFPVSTVYYSMNGGEELIVPEMPPLAIFSTEIPYMSSTFYYTHGEDVGPVDFTVTQGTWRRDGDDATAYFVMDGTGLVDAYYASGSQEYSAYLEQGYGGLSGYTVFEVYNNDGEQINTMWFDGLNQFYLGEPQNDTVFIKD